MILKLCEEVIIIMVGIIGVILIVSLILIYYSEREDYINLEDINLEDINSEEIGEECGCALYDLNPLLSCHFNKPCTEEDKK